VVTKVLHFPSTYYCSVDVCNQTSSIIKELNLTNLFRLELHNGNLTNRYK